MTAQAALSEVVAFAERQLGCELHIQLCIGCTAVECEHAKTSRVFAHVFHYPAVICVAEEFGDLADGFKLGVLLHEIGHLCTDGTDAAADLWVDEQLGIDLNYVETVQYVDPTEWLELC